MHAAAVTDFGVGEPATSALNVDGTARVLDLAAEAGARVLYVSTAFVATDLTTEARGARSREAAVSPQAYLSSKRRAEALVRGSGLEATIARPSVVLGDSRTGAIARFQGLHAVFRGILRNEVPLMPMPAASPVDVVPVDVVAEALAALVSMPDPAGQVPAHGRTGGAVGRRPRRRARAPGAGGGPARSTTCARGRRMAERPFRPVFVDPLPTGCGAASTPWSR